MYAKRHRTDEEEATCRQHMLQGRLCQCGLDPACVAVAGGGCDMFRALGDPEDTMPNAYPYSRL
jgi:hypothetical protein